MAPLHSQVLSHSILCLQVVHKYRRTYPSAQGNPCELHLKKVPRKFNCLFLYIFIFVRNIIFAGLFNAQWYYNANVLYSVVRVYVIPCILLFSHGTAMRFVTYGLRIIINELFVLSNNFEKICNFNAFD